ncbi:MAG: hypothetical protein MZV63_24355 [Marinilabiliales bacterium]|nr:hypothetical protein [Marinilabiliales bacterium]
MTGWNWHEGYDGTPGFSILVNTRGYNVYTYDDQTALFSGSITLSDGNHIFTNSQISYSGSDPQISGWNLLGNPFTSAVNADAFKWTGSGRRKRIIYFTKEHTYPVYNTVTRQGISGATNIVPPMQGFFVHANSSKQKSLTIEASSRIYSTGPRYKSTNQQADYADTEVQYLR